MPRNAPQPRLRRERGSGTLEYIAATALAGALIVGLLLVLPAPGPVLAGKVHRVVCVVLSIGSGDACAGAEPGGASEPAAPPFDPEPAKCKVGEHGEKLSAEVTFLVLKVGENAGLLETRYSNGTVSYTATNGAQVGVVVSAPGAEAKVGGGEAGEKIDLGGDLKVDAGSTWNFADQAEADAMRKQLDAYRHEQTLKTVSPGYKLWTLVHGGRKPPRLPDQSVSTIDLGAYVDGQAGVQLPGQKDTSGGLAPPIPGTGVTAPTPPKIGIKFGLNQRWTMITDTIKETKTYTTTGEGYGQISGTVGPVKGEYKGLLGSSMSWTRDKDNQLTNVTLVSTTENKATVSGLDGEEATGGKGTATAGGSGVHVTTASLDLRTPEQRAVAEAWLQHQADDPLALVSPETAFPDTLVPGDAFQNLMFTGSTVSDVHYRNVTDKVGFAAKIKAGVSIGVDLSKETNDSRGVSATYLGAPGNGSSSRPPVSFPKCTGQ